MAEFQAEGKLLSRGRYLDTHTLMSQEYIRAHSTPREKLPAFEK